MHVLPLRRFVAGTLVFLFPLTALAATRTWDAGGTDNNWSTAANWSDNTAPTAADIALFDGTGKKNATIDAAFGGSIAELRLGSSNTGTITAVRSLTVNGNVSLSGGTLTINGGNTVTVKGSWQNDGNATFTSNTGTVLLTGTGSSHVVKESGGFYDFNINNGLVGHWRLDETASGAVVVDASGYRNNGVMRGGGPTPSTSTPSLNFQNLRALEFDGVDDHVNIQNLNPHFDNASLLTISAWFYIEVDSSGMIVSLPETNVGHNGPGVLVLDATSIRYDLVTHGGSKFSDVTVSDVRNEWHHVALTYNGSSLKCYFDGGEVCSESVALGSGIKHATKEVNIGRFGDAFATHWDGLIDDVRIYSRALSSSEIQSLASGNQGTGSGKYTLGSAISVNGDLTVYSGTLDTSSSNYGITASGSFINNATFVPRSATVTLSGIATTLKMYGTSLYNLTIASAKSAILRTAATVTNALTVASSAALNLNGFNLTATVASISNLGTITEGTGSIIHTSSLSASPSSLAIGSSISISLTDSDANVNGTAQDTVTVTANGETITLTETTNTSGIFQGSVSTAHGAGVASNGVIENNDACSFFVNVAYSDPQDGTDSATAQVTVTDAGVVPCEIRGGGGGRRGSPGRGGVAPMVIDRTIVPSSPPEEPPTMSDSLSLIFTDVPVSAWYFAAVQELASLDIISGYNDAQGNALNRFGPADPVTFAEALKMTLGVSGADIPQGGVPSDIALRAHWSAAYLSYAQTLSLSVFPTAVTIDAPISRGKLAQLLVDILQPSSSGDEISFTDVASSHEHASAIRIAASQGWMMGDTDTNGTLLHRFRPDDTLNRAEIAQVLVRVLQ